MRNKNNKTFYFCNSCIHTFGEQDINLLQYKDEEQELKDIEKYCNICGQKIDDNNDIHEISKQVDLFKSAVKNPNLTVVCFIAPSIRVSISNEFMNGKIEDCQGKIISALKILGCDIVFDMNIGADFTVVEEAHEFVKRYNSKKNLPMFTSCCPGWVNFITKTYPEFIPNLSTCKSPQQMFGALISKYYASYLGKKSTDLFVVSIVPCLIKKLEARYSSNNASIGLDVDAAITTSELIELIKESDIDFNNLENSEFDNFFGTASGAGAIFGSTGGVMEAALRTIGDKISDNEIDNAMYQIVRGREGIRRSEISVGDKKIKIAIVSGLASVKPLIESIKSGEELDFVEVMACPGGCVGGGGQPKQNISDIEETIHKRAEELYNCANKNINQKAHKNPSLEKIYTKYLGDIGGDKAYKILHRGYN